MKSKQEMYPLVQQWYKNKKSILKEDFCDKFNIEIHKLNYWIKKYNKETHPVKSPSKGEFIPLTIKESLTRETGSTPEIELDLPHGIRLRIY
jgi:hypothetical protein